MYIHNTHHRLRIRAGAAFALALLLLFVGCSDAVRAGKKPGSDTPGPVARVEGKQFLIKGDDGAYESAFLDGVNIGACKAGTFPGEFGVTEDDYFRWMQYISDMNVEVIRVYVNLMPAFYDALYRFNTTSKKPLYLMHGVYVNEDLLGQYPDVYDGDGAVIELFHHDIRNAVDMIHGNAVVEKTAGNAGGTYTSDVSDWVIGWILGIEWSADVVIATNDGHPENAAFSGEYVRTEGASPFEAFLAATAEQAIAYEEEHYREQRPVALNNWCTTDPLSHPNEPTPETEDGVSVDVEHILATDAFSAGFFASYHVYPYYPDFLSYDLRYRTDDPYGTYLAELNAYHSMPVLIAEYGIPSSRGIAHKNAVSGMSQGHASEKQQAEWIMALNESIRSTGCMGALIFTWQDEWFKRTWNSMDYEVADRRPFWQNVQSPEECFGLLAIEPGAKESIVTLDGRDDEWRRKDVLTENDGVSLSVKSDAAYLYLLIRAEDFDFETDTLYLPVDVLPEQGNTSYEGLTFATGADFLIRLSGRNDSVIWTDVYYDIFQYDYAVRTEMLDPVPHQLEKDSGCFHSILLAMNRQYTLPETGERTPFEAFDTGMLHFGCGDPASEEYDSLSDLCAEGDTVELRIPWMMLNIMDPSSKQAAGDFYTQDEIAPVTVEGVSLGVCRDGARETVPMALYTWENWDMPDSHERLKQSYYILQAYFADRKQGGA